MSKSHRCRRARPCAGAAAAVVASLLVVSALPAAAATPTRGPVVPDHIDRLPPVAAPAPAPPPPPDPRQVAVDQVIQTALAQQGKPYRWAAIGPDAFDCSGFTRFAWLAAAVELSHNSAAQYGQTTHIGLDELQPGDLVYYGMGHVALYLGNGQIIHAPHRGDVVRIEPLEIWRSPTAASRVELP